MLDGAGDDVPCVSVARQCQRCYGSYLRAHRNRSLGSLLTDVAYQGGVCYAS